MSWRRWKIHNSGSWEVQDQQAAKSVSGESLPPDSLMVIMCPSLMKQGEIITGVFLKYGHCFF